MEEKKFDPNSLIGFVLIFVILDNVPNQPSERKLLLKKLKKLVVTNETKTKEITTKDVVAPVLAGDTVQLAKLQKSLGDFAYSATLASAKESYTTIEIN
jgi:YidC/Oxa1 family membrane protein insertase